MSTLSIIFLILFGIDVVLHSYGETQIYKDPKRQNLLIRWITKPLLMLLLLGMYLSSNNITIIPFIVAALAFGFIGDIFLMFMDQLRYYILGTISFILGHISYIIAFSLNFGPFSDFVWWRLLLYIPTICLVFVYALPKVNGKMPGIENPLSLGYTVALILMSLFTILRLASTQIYDPQFILVWLGAQLFVLSDMLLSVNRYSKKLKNAVCWYDMFYAVGQFFIVFGIILLG
jgi:uncharacterized membrane protein YhhN